MEWSLETNREGRPVYRCRVPYGNGVIVAGAVIDYRPGEPPFYALVRTPTVVDKWFYKLDDAKGFVIATYAEARMRGDM